MTQTIGSEDTAAPVTSSVRPPRYYTPIQVAVATAFGSVGAAAITLSRNKVYGGDTKDLHGFYAIQAVILTLILLVLAWMPADEPLRKAFYALFIPYFLYAQHLQRRLPRLAIADKTDCAGWGRTALAALAGIVLYFSYAVVVTAVLLLTGLAPQALKDQIGRLPATVQTVPAGQEQPVAQTDGQIEDDTLPGGIAADGEDVQ